MSSTISPLNFFVDLPTVETRRQILIYSSILVPLGMVPSVMGFGGSLYTLVAAIFGAFFLVFAYECYRQREGAEADRAAKNLFAFSILYLLVLFAVLLVEHGFGLDGGLAPRIWTS